MRGVLAVKRLPTTIEQCDQARESQLSGHWFMVVVIGDLRRLGRNRGGSFEEIDLSPLTPEMLSNMIETNVVFGALSLYLPVSQKVPVGRVEQSSHKN
jgi:hypothetical protein